MSKNKFRVGAMIDLPHEVQIIHEPGIHTYRKIMLEQQGGYFATTAPLDVCVGEDYRVWKLSDKLLIAYDPHAIHENLWWRDLMNKLPEQLHKCPVMKGDLCVYVHWNGLNWNDLILRRELINWLVCKYKRGHPYHFCDFSEEGVETRRNGRCAVV